MRTSKRYRYAALALLIAAPPLIWAIWHATSPRTPPEHFYGLVIDQDGAPIAGAEVVGRCVALDPEHSGLYERMPRHHVRTYADARGRFEITLPAGYDQLWVDSVAKPGYDMVICSESVAGRDYWRHDNHEFPFASYRSDPSRPAIFPLHLRGSPKPAGRPSRGGYDKFWIPGGSDVRPNSRWVANEPMPGVVRWAGPNAPRTP